MLECLHHCGCAAGSIKALTAKEKQVMAHQELSAEEVELMLLSVAENNRLQVISCSFCLRHLATNATRCHSQAVRCPLFQLRNDRVILILSRFTDERSCTTCNCATPATSRPASTGRWRRDSSLVRLARTYLHVSVPLLMNLLPCFAESAVQFLCFTESVIGIWRSWVNMG